jgi:hypothetical protein
LKILYSMCLIHWCLYNFWAFFFVSVLKVGVIALSDSLCVSLDVNILCKNLVMCVWSHVYLYNSELISSSGNFIFWKFIINSHFLQVIIPSSFVHLVIGFKNWMREIFKSRISSFHCILVAKYCGPYFYILTFWVNQDEYYYMNQKILSLRQFPKMR